MGEINELKQEVDQDLYKEKSTANVDNLLLSGMHAFMSYWRLNTAKFCYTAPFRKTQLYSIIGNENETHRWDEKNRERSL